MLFETVSQPGFAFPQPLCEKYRPKTIADFIGLDKQKKILSAFARRPTSGAWLFVGPSGVGKSTMALAFAEEIRGELHKIPSQKCTVGEIDNVVRQCWYAPFSAGGFHVVLADECDKMSPAAQLALLSKLDSTDPAPNTIWIFTANCLDGLEKRFLSRCKVLEFSSYGMRSELAAHLASIWALETSAASTLDFERIAKESTNNVRDAMNVLEIELLAAL